MLPSQQDRLSEVGCRGNIRLTIMGVMSLFSHDDVKLAYDDSGETDLSPIVFLHGLSSARTTWARITPSVEGRNRILTIDHRGHGESSRAPDTYVLDRYGDDAIAFCEEIVGKPAVLVGHSLGGVVAAYVAGQRPDLVRAVLLEDPPLYRGGEQQPPESNSVAAFFPMLRQILGDLQQRGAPVEDCEAMLHATPAMNGKGTLADVMGPEGSRAHALAWMQVDPEVFTPAIDGRAITGGNPDATLQCPTLVLRADPKLGAAFTTEDAERFARSNPAAVIKVVDGASHIIHDEQPDRFRTELGDLLDTVQT